MPQPQTNPPVDKRAKAQQHLEAALRELGLALSALGGKTRNKPKIFPPPYKYIARQYIESLIIRLRVTTAILAQRKQDERLVRLPREFIKTATAFEAVYLAGREEKC